MAFGTFNSSSLPLSMLVLPTCCLMTRLQESISGSGSAETIHHYNPNLSTIFITYDRVLQHISKWSRSVPRQRRRWGRLSFPWDHDEPLQDTGSQQQTREFLRPCPTQLQESINKLTRSIDELTLEFIGDNKCFIRIQCFGICFTILVLTVVIHLVPPEVPAPGVLVVPDQRLKSKVDSWSCFFFPIMRWTFPAKSKVLKYFLFK